MEVPENHRDIVRKKVTDNWHCLGKRSEAHILPIYEKIIKLKTPEAQEIYGVKAEGICLWKDSFVEFYLSKERFRVALESVTRLLFNFEKAKKHIQKVIDYSHQAKEFARFFKETDLTKLTSIELLEKYKKAITLYTTSFMYGFISWGGYVLQTKAQALLKEKKQELSKLGLDEEEAFGVLAKSVQKTAYLEKEEALDSLSQKHKQFQEITYELEKDINEFLKEYAWVGYDYGGPLMSFQEAIESIKDRKCADEEGITREEILYFCNFTDEEKELFEILHLLSLIKDERNLCDDFLHYCLDFFFTEVGKRYGFTKDETRYLWPEEVELLLSGKRIYTKEYLSQKRKYCAGDTSFEGPCRYFIGEEAEKIHKKILTSLEEEAKPAATSPKDKNIIKGTVASSGNAKGKVRVIHILDDVSKMQQDEILVTHMTSPRYMLAMRKAAGIVTDDGGLTSHAAIISREFKIPCIVGTKNATKLLHDGDEVEVDTKNGVVKIISRKEDTQNSCKEVNMKIDKSKTALVVVDFENDMLDENGKLAAFGIAAHAKEKNIVANTKKLLEKARAEGMKVIYTKVEYSEGYPEVQSSKAPIQLGLSQTGALIRGTHGSAIVDELKPAEGEAIVSKSRISPFTNPEFKTQLEGIETIILTGVATNFAIESIARTASDMNYEVIVAEDCCASMAKPMHEFSTNNILPNLGTVTDSETIYNSLN